MTPDSASAHGDSANIYRTRQMQAVAERWDKKAAAWDRELADPSCHLNEDNAYQRFVEELAVLVEEKREFCHTRGIIDAGCATGLVLAGIVSSFAWGIGVDVSPQMIRAAQAKQVPNTRFMVADCFNLRASCPLAGAIVSRGVLLSHYGPEQGQALLSSAHSCLADGGFILWDFLNQAARASYQHVAENKAYFDPEQVCAMAARAGFRKTRIYGERARRVRMLYAE